MFVEIASRSKQIFCEWSRLVIGFLYRDEFDTEWFVNGMIILYLRVRLYIDKYVTSKAKQSLKIKKTHGHRWHLNLVYRQLSVLHRVIKKERELLRECES